MKRAPRDLLGCLLVLSALLLGACSGGSSAGTPASGAAGTPASGTAGTPASGAAGTSGAAGATAPGAAGTSSAAGAGSAGAAPDADVTGAAGSGAAGAPADAGAAGAGAAGSAAVSDASADGTAGVHAFPMSQIVKLMVVGSSNELGTCWRAFLWQELRMNGVMNFDFVGQQKGGPNCGVTAWNDTDLQAMSGIIITGLPAST